MMSSYHFRADPIPAEVSCQNSDTQKMIKFHAYDGSGKGAERLETILKVLPSQTGFSVTVINDCLDSSGQMRIATRIHSYFHSVPVAFCPVEHGPLEAAGHLVDALDAKALSPGVVLVNVAPRNATAEKYPNGSPFGYFLWHNKLVISTIQGETLSCAKALLPLRWIHVLEATAVLKVVVGREEIPAEWAKHIEQTQFRSYEFQPLVMALLLRGVALPFRKESADTIPDAPKSVWYRDRFGNCKTTVSTRAAGIVVGQQVRTAIGVLDYYERLVDVPHNKPALVSGSSGIGAGPLDRFLEVVVRGGNAGERFKLGVGSVIF
jgi:hypothetical protein